MSYVEVHTTQNIALQYQTASVSDRIFAILLDWLFQIIALVTIVIIVFNSLDGGIFARGSGTIATLIMLPIFLYPLLTEFFLNGQTFGKKILNIKVVKLDGSQASLGAYLLRWLLGLIELYMLSGGLALLVLLINPRGQRLGDMAAGTTVIKLSKPVSLNDTIFHHIDETYQPVFLAVHKLNDRDIAIVQEVMNVVGELENAAELQLKTRNALLTKMDIETSMPTGQFLQTIIKDYNAIHGKLG